ncbi:MAG TPA: hypothetical protein VI749_07565 [Candidatus Omnitrophota bacterium]|nr:hypothetical protein [Candidatus Omnitrophota bacterium]
MKLQKISFLVSKQEIDFLKRVIFLEPFLLSNLEHAYLEEKKYRIEFDAEDLKELLGAVSTASENIIPHRASGSYNRFLERLKVYANLVKTDDESEAL